MTASAEPQTETAAEQPADTLETAQDITETTDEPKQEEPNRDELKKYHVEELTLGELRKRLLFTDDESEAAAFMADKLEELSKAEGVTVWSSHRGRIIYHDGETMHYIYIWNIDEAKSIYWMQRDSERHRILRKAAEKFEAWKKAQAEREAQKAAEPQTAEEPTDTKTDTQTTAQGDEKPASVSPLVEALADLLQTFGRIIQEAKQWEGVTIPAATLERWRTETEQGTKQTAEKFAEVCACLGSLTPDSRREFDALGVIFWTLSEQIRNGYDPATINPATDYARAQLFDLIERTQTPQQAAAVRAAFSPEEYPDYFNKAA